MRTGGADALWPARALAARVSTKVAGAGPVSSTGSALACRRAGWRVVYEERAKARMRAGVGMESRGRDLSQPAGLSGLRR
jgi:hypothetical protein